ncbi:hypothetical protein BD769DRAFT_1391263 [Suillus cothurnatus]|nr:hypothetical protein BD769DRAFT_1391263 [Suillus cothurnatus]
MSGVERDREPNQVGCSLHRPWKTYVVELYKQKGTACYDTLLGADTPEWHWTAQLRSFLIRQVLSSDIIRIMALLSEGPWKADVDSHTSSELRGMSDAVSDEKAAKLRSPVPFWGIRPRQNINGMREIKDMSMVPLGVYARLALSYQSPGKDEVIYQKLFESICVWRMSIKPVARATVLSEVSWSDFKRFKAGHNELNVPDNASGSMAGG